jgi:hypothetical protein
MRQEKTLKIRANHFGEPLLFMHSCLRVKECLHSLSIHLHMNSSCYAIIRICMSAIGLCMCK